MLKKETILGHRKPVVGDGLPPWSITLVRRTAVLHGGKVKMSAKPSGNSMSTSDIIIILKVHPTAKGRQYMYNR